jgi:hypothetical protein
MVLTPLTPLIVALSLIDAEDSNENWPPPVLVSVTPPPVRVVVTLPLDCPDDCADPLLPIDSESVRWACDPEKVAELVPLMLRLEFSEAPTL